MDERELRELISAVKAGRLSRRAFVHKMLGLGLAAPLATQLLTHAGLAQTAPPTDYKPTKAGGGGALKMLFWQAATLLNPHFAVGTKDQEGARIFYEPLAAWDPEGNLVPVLAAEIPDIENGGVAADGMSVTWKLKKGVQWHDGEPLTADDIVFNWEYASDPATAATTIGDYRDAKVEKIDPLTVRIRFEKPTPFWAGPFVAGGGMIIPKHLFETYKGANSREAPANLKPVGTGPYRFVEFKPGDLVRGERNPSYHVANRPYFDTIEMKGGGDAVSAARAVIQTGEYDYAWNMQVEDEILVQTRKRRQRQGSRGDRAEPGDRAHPDQLRRSVDRGRRRTIQPQDEASAAQRSGRQAGAPPARRSRFGREVHIWTHRSRDRELPQQSGALRLEEHEVGVQRRQGEPIVGRGRLEARIRRHPYQRRQKAEARIPDLDQCATPKDPVNRKAGLPEGRHRLGAEVGDAIGFLLL